MSDNEFIKDLVAETVLTRRSFMKWSAAVGGATAFAANGGLQHLLADAAFTTAAAGSERIVRTCCPAHNCGGKCMLITHVQDGTITRLSSDDRDYDEIDSPRLLACARGKSYRRRIYHPDRLKYPMKRVGERGSGQYERISWDEALDTIASEMERIKATYGNEAFYIPYGTGSYTSTAGSDIPTRLFSLFGGYLNYYNNYSWACIQRVTQTVWGTNTTGSQRQDWVNARYILAWGWNPAEMIDGTNSAYFIRKAKENGAKVVVIDPRNTMTATALGDQWIGIRPGTDTAMMSAMAYVIITEELYDKDIVENAALGFDSAHMPEGYEGEESYKDYILGTRDNTPKTPEWAEAITGVPREQIIQIAREYATIKPAMLYQGYGMQRRAYGEQVVRAGCVLAAITGNYGLPGTHASGMAFQEGGTGPWWTTFPGVANPVSASIPTFLYTDAILRGPELGPEDGLTGTDKLSTGIKMIFATCTNALVNQHGNINRTVEILKDTSLCEFIVLADHFMTPSAKFADILLPASMQWENWGLQDGWKYGEEVYLMPQIVEKPFETKSDYELCAAVAERLGLGDAFTEGRSERDVIEYCLDQQRQYRFPDLPDLETFEQSNVGVYQAKVTQPAIALKDFRADPAANPLPTPSGKIEIFSPELFDFGNPQEVPAVPKYIQEWESPFGPEAAQYPLQALGHHYMHRVHSTHDNIDWLEDAFPQRVYMNPIDAAARGLETGDVVKVFNERGAMLIPVRITNRIVPGTVNIPQGAWYDPDSSGVDRGGAVNILTSHRHTPFAFGNAQHTIMVQVQKVEA